MRKKFCKHIQLVLNIFPHTTQANELYVKKELKEKKKDKTADKTADVREKVDSLMEEVEDFTVHHLAGSSFVIK